MKKKKSKQAPTPALNARRELFQDDHDMSDHNKAGPELTEETHRKQKQKQNGFSSTRSNGLSQSFARKFHREESCFCRGKNKIGGIEIVETAILIGVIFSIIAVIYLWNIYSPGLRTIHGESSGVLSIHWDNNKHLYIAGAVGCAAISGVAALLCCGLSWMLVYFDSEQPGVCPPTPLSPSKLRKESGHTFHLLYITPLLNCACFWIYSLWKLRHFYILEYERSN